jgi:glycerol uptake facilitator-like aquaporin
MVCTPSPHVPSPQFTGAPELPLGIAVTVAALIAFGPLCGAFGGALFNPVHNAAFIAAGKDTVRFNTARMAFQIAGASLGAFLAVNMLPEWLKECAGHAGKGGQQRRRRRRWRAMPPALEAGFQAHGARLTLQIPRGAATAK